MLLFGLVNIRGCIKMEIEEISEAIALESALFEETHLEREVWHYQGQNLGVHVGELQEKWQFPSDHIPVGVIVNDHNIASWNILNTAWMDWVEQNSQGLQRSILISENIPVEEGSSLTVRELHTVQMVLEILENHSLLCLQECGKHFIAALEKALPSNMRIVLSEGKTAICQNIVIYDSSKFTLNEERSTMDFPYSESDPERSVMNLVFQDGNDTYRIINVHVPGDPEKPAMMELGEFVAKEIREDEITICMGDMNFNEIEARAAFDQVQGDYSLLSPYPTNISPVIFDSKCIDHIFISGTTQIEVNAPEDLIEGLTGTLNLLTTSCSFIEGLLKV